MRTGDAHVVAVVVGPYVSCKRERAVNTFLSDSNFRSNLCQVLVGESTDISEPLARSLGVTGDYLVGSNLYSKEPVAMVTRDGDPQWSDFVFWTVQEKEKITNNLLQVMFTPKHKKIKI